MQQLEPRWNRSESGLTLIELSVSLVIFSFLILSVGMTLLSGFSQRRESFESYRAMNAMRSEIAQIQELANLAPDLTMQVGVSSLYSRLDGAVVTVARIPGGKLSIECFANETTVPAFLGGPQDLNFDGDAEDDLGNVSNGTDLKLVPMSLVLTYEVNGETLIISAHRLFTATEDDPKVVTVTPPDPNDPLNPWAGGGWDGGSGDPDPSVPDTDPLF